MFSLCFILSYFQRTPLDLARRDGHGALVLRLLLRADPTQDPIALGEISYLASKAKYKHQEKEEKAEERRHHHHHQQQQHKHGSSNNNISNPQQQKRLGNGIGRGEGRR